MFARRRPGAQEGSRGQRGRNDGDAAGDEATTPQGRRAQAQGTNHEDRWTDIVERRRDLLRKGYEATSLQDIADAVGLLKGSI